MIKFGLITEGVSDQEVIENILTGYFNNDDLTMYVNPLQPLRDATDEESIKKFGNWYKVFEYCKSNYFKEAFQRNDYLIIQIDTDVCNEKHYDVKDTRPDGTKKTPPELIKDVKLKFKEVIGNELYDKHKERIIFAICVNAIECWLLPIYYSDKTKEKTNNCLYKLNNKLKYKINPEAKNPDLYDDISRKYCKHQELLKLYKKNPSLKIFIEELMSKKIKFEEEDI